MVSNNDIAHHLYWLIYSKDLNHFMIECQILPKHQSNRIKVFPKVMIKIVRFTFFPLKTLIFQLISSFHPIGKGFGQFLYIKCDIISNIK